MKGLIGMAEFHTGFTILITLFFIAFSTIRTSHTVCLFAPFTITTIMNLVSTLQFVAIPYHVRIWIQMYLYFLHFTYLTGPFFAICYEFHIFHRLITFIYWFNRHPGVFYASFWKELISIFIQDVRLEDGWDWTNDTLLRQNLALLTIHRQNVEYSFYDIQYRWEEVRQWRHGSHSPMHNRIGFSDASIIWIRDRKRSECQCLESQDRATREWRRVEIQWRGTAVRWGSNERPKVQNDNRVPFSIW